MPELPEVETYVRALKPLLKGKTILSAEVNWPRTIAAPDADRFSDLVRGRSFSSFGRRGKYMLLGLDSAETLIVHLRMTGELRLHPPPAPGASAADAPVDKHTHVLFDLDTREQLRYRDTRKFGRIWLVEDTSEVVGKLGPEPLDEAFVPQTLAQTLAGRRANVKALLLNQSLLAGVGNIYADESSVPRQDRPPPRRELTCPRRDRASSLGFKGCPAGGNRGAGQLCPELCSPDGSKGRLPGTVPGLPPQRRALLRLRYAN